MALFYFSAKRKKGRFSVIRVGTGSVLILGNFLGDPDDLIRSTYISDPPTAKIRPRGHKTARRATKRPPTGKPKWSYLRIWGTYDPIGSDPSGSKQMGVIWV